MRRSVDTTIRSIRKIFFPLINYADSFSFVIRIGEPISTKVVNVMEKLNPHYIECKKTSEWPGTSLLWDQANLYIYNLNKETANCLYTTEDDLFKWLLPFLPEDLVCYRNGKPLFISITHEKDAYFEFTRDEELYLRDHSLIE